MPGRLETGGFGGFWEVCVGGIREEEDLGFVDRAFLYLVTV